jgi:hypothetical protein
MNYFPTESSKSTFRLIGLVAFSWHILEIPAIQIATSSLYLGISTTG